MIAPLLASCGLPVFMLAGRGLGHTGGTIDKLESIPGMDLRLDRGRCLDLLARCGLAIGAATAGLAPADRRLYALRDVTATVDSIPLITASILSKKLATAAAAVVFDVKTGNGAFLPELDRSLELARGLVETARALGTPAACLVTDMSQPLGRWAGHAAEVPRVARRPGGRGAGGSHGGHLRSRGRGRAARRPARGAKGDGGGDRLRPRPRGLRALGRAPGRRSRMAARPRFDLAPVERPLLAPRSGTLAAVDVRQLGLLLVEAGGGRAHPGDAIDFGISLDTRVRLGAAVEEGEELARVYLRRENERLAEAFAACFTVGDAGEAPPLIAGRVG